VAYCLLTDAAWLRLDMKSTYRRHEIELKSHRDDVNSNDTGNAQIEVLAGDDSMQPQTKLGIAGPVRQLL